MGFMNEIGGLLRQYEGANASNAPESATEDFGKVAAQAPAPSIANGLRDAFNSNQTPPFGQMVSQMFGQSNNDQRAGILNHLLQAAGGGGLAGGLSSILQGSSSVTPAQAAQVPPEAVQQLAEHAQSKDPSVVDRASEFYSQHPTLVQGLGAGALALIMSRMSQRG